MAFEKKAYADKPQKYYDLAEKYSKVKLDRLIPNT